jgi:hypothetical protein
LPGVGLEAGEDGMSRTSAVKSATVKPPGAMASARAAASTARARGLVHIDAAGAGAAGLAGGGQGIEQGVGDEADIDAVQRREELAGHLLQAGDDGRELVQGPAAAQVFGVAGDAFEPQDAFAFGITLQGSRSGP